MTAGEAASFVYKRIKNGLYEDATLEVNTRTINVTRANQLSHGPRFGIFSNDELLRSLWVRGESSYRSLMEELTGPNSAVWAIKILG